MIPRKNGKTFQPKHFIMMESGNFWFFETNSLKAAIA
jgi:hypothetical protein